jgi:hypothetical protein
MFVISRFNHFMRVKPRADINGGDFIYFSTPVTQASIDPYVGEDGGSPVITSGYILHDMTKAERPAFYKKVYTSIEAAEEAATVLRREREAEIEAARNAPAPDDEPATEEVPTSPRIGVSPTKGKLARRRNANRVAEQEPISEEDK